MYKLLSLLIIILVVLLGIGIYGHINKDIKEPVETITPSPIVSTIPSIIPSETPTITYDTTSPDSIYVIANKKHSLGEYEPSDLVAVSHPGSNGAQYMREEAAQSFEEMMAKADEDGIVLYAQSGYRSYNTQVSLYQSYANRDGIAAADTYSSRAGYSDHQTGLAMDIMGENTRMNASDRSYCPIEQCEGSPASLWLEENAADFGFILRFPQGKQDITGYVYEWWHYRYVGREVAKEIKESNLTMEEFFNVSGGDYENN